MTDDQRTKLVIQFRRDYASRWEAHSDVVPAMGEPCFVVDKNILKIGDGSTKFCDLKPVNDVEIYLTGDGRSIILEDNIFKLMGYDAADIGAQPQRTANGIKWVVPVDFSDAIAILQSDVDVIKSDINDLQDSVSFALSKFDEAVRAIEIVEF
jgi:hypothetical protein